MGNNDFGIDLDTINSITEQIANIHNNGTKFSIVVEGVIYLEESLHLHLGWIGLQPIIQE